MWNKFNFSNSEWIWDILEKSRHLFSRLNWHWPGTRISQFAWFCYKLLYVGIYGAELGAIMCPVSQLFEFNYLSLLNNQLLLCKKKEVRNVGTNKTFYESRTFSARPIGRFDKIRPSLSSRRVLMSDTASYYFGYLRHAQKSLQVWDSSMMFPI